MDDEVAEYSAQVHRHDIWVIIRVILVVALLIAIVLIGLDNRDDVRIGYVFGDAEAPIWIVLLIALAVGVLIGWLLRFRRRS